MQLKTIVDNLRKEMELFGGPIEKDKPSAEGKLEKPAAKNVPSNKPAAQKFEEGKVYTDAKGNKAKYVNGKWEPQ